MYTSVTVKLGLWVANFKHSKHSRGRVLECRGSGFRGRKLGIGGGGAGIGVEFWGSGSRFRG